jgi:hypothetical protein
MSSNELYPAKEQDSPARQTVFVPFSEALLCAAGNELGELVPYQLDYKCVRLLDGTYEFLTEANPLH